MNQQDTVSSHDSAPAGEFRIPQNNTEEIRIAVDEIFNDPVRNLSESALLYAQSSPQLNEKQIVTPETLLMTPLDEYHFVNHATTVMRTEGVAQRVEKSGILMKTLGLVGFQPNAKRMEEDLIQKEAELSEQLFDDKYRPENEIWQFVHLDGDWYWTRTRKGEDNPYLVTHFYLSEDGSHIKMIESLTDGSEPSVPGVVEDMDNFINGYIRPYMELVERQLYAAPKARHSKLRKH